MLPFRISWVKSFCQSTHRSPMGFLTDFKEMACWLLASKRCGCSNPSIARGTRAACAQGARCGAAWILARRSWESNLVHHLWPDAQLQRARDGEVHLFRVTDDGLGPA